MTIISTSKLFTGIILLVMVAACTKDGDGNNGYNSLLKTTIEPSGVNCPSGGLKVDIGLDLNRNGALDSAEIDEASFICNDSPDTYTAILNQTGENPPVASVINNSLNLNITWSRVSKGHYKGILGKELDLAKSIILNDLMVKNSW